MLRWKTHVSVLIILLATSKDALKTRMSDPLDVVNIGSNNVHDINLLKIPPGKISTIETDVPGEPLGPNDFNMAYIEEGDLPVGLQSRMDPIEIAGLYQGDISLSLIDDVQHLSTAAHTSGRLRNAIIDIDRRWPNGEIPYVISKAYDSNARGVIAQAMKRFHNKTCISFTPRTSQKDHIHILKGDGCSSSVGRIGGTQTVSLGLGCLYVGVVMHELMHATGFWHEQSREDRDKYIQIIWENIQPGMEFNFHKYNWSEIRNLGVVYDPNSIMHYGPYAFARNRQKPTIIPKVKHGIGQRKGFSKLDRYKIEHLYGCNEDGIANTTNALQEASPGVCRDHHVKCPEWSKLGECKKNPLWMAANCKLSCQLCEKSCADLHVNCTTWAEKEECSNNPPYMMLFCQMSCGLCKVIDSTAGCKDHNPHCRKWGKKGLCRTNQDMNIFCPQTCKKC